MVAADRQSFLVRASWATLVVAAGLVFLLSRKYQEIPANNVSAPKTVEAAVCSWNEPASLNHVDWRRFRTVGRASAGETGLAARFRLAGTFFTVNNEGEESRMAVIDDLSIARQSIVREDENIDENLLVVRILTDRVVLRGPRGEESLWLSFAGQGGSKDDNGSPNASEVEKDPKNRFGKRTGKRSWVFERKALMDYHEELMDNPERLLAVFDSMKPVYTKDRRISGYRLGVEGEADFFTAMGIQQGDVVRRVNSMDMTNRRRCEYLIGQFVKNRANAFVVDLERRGKRIRQTYEVR